VVGKDWEDGFFMGIAVGSTAETSSDDTTAYVPPSDWINIDNCDAGNINLLVADTSIATYAFVCTTSSGQYHVDWGDGTSSNVDGGSTAQHTYAIGTGQVCSRGYTTFKVVISPVIGNLLSFKVTNHSLANSPQTYGILACKCGAIYIASLSNAFYGSTNPVVKCTSLEWFKTSGTLVSCLNTTSMLGYCSSLQDVDLSGFTSVTNATDMFAYCYSILDIDISPMVSLVNIYQTFSNCSALQTLNAKGLANITTIGSTFLNCQSLKNVDMSGMTSLQSTTRMFENCRSLKSVSMDGLSSVSTSDYMFSGCNSLLEADLSSMTSLYNASSMFYYCYALKKVNLSGLGKLFYANAMFGSCFSLPDADLSYMASLGRTPGMFLNCYNLQSVNLSGLNKITDSQQMFDHCFAIQYADISDMILVNTASSMFAYCYSLQSISSNGFSTSATSLVADKMFSFCEQLATIDLSSAKLTYFEANGSSGFVTKLTSFILVSSSTFAYSSITQTLNLSYTSLSNTAIDAIFTALPNVVSKTVNITGSTGAATCTRSIATAKGWTVTG